MATMRVNTPRIKRSLDMHKGTMAAETPSARIITDANGRVSITDDTGRVIVIKSLTPLDQMRVAKHLGGDLASNAQYMAWAMYAAAVVSFDGEPVEAPNSELEYEFIIKKLGSNGISAMVAHGMATIERVKAELAARKITPEEKFRDDVKNS